MKKMSCSIIICTVLLIPLATGSASATQFCGLRPCPPPPPPPPPPLVGSCQSSSSLTVQVTGTNVIAYVPKGYWEGGATGVSVVNVEGSSITNKLVSTPSVTNSCASNSTTGKTVCVANNTDVYVLTGTTLSTTLTSGGSGTIGFSGGSCTNCGVAMDAVHNKAVIGMSIAGSPGFQFLNLNTMALEPAFKSPAGFISEDVLIDPTRNYLLSPSENNNYEVAYIANTLAPTFFENKIPYSAGIEADSSGEDCSTGIALATAEFSVPSNLFIADLTQQTHTPGTPSGTWTAPSQVLTLTESVLAAGPSGMAVAQGSHIGIVSGEFGGNQITAIALPTKSGSGTPALTDWVSCSVSAAF